MSLKKNFRKTPQRIIEKLDRIQSREIVVGCVKQISRTDIEDSRFAHLGLYIDEQGLHYPENIIPPANQGRHSDWNNNGREIVRRDLPKETHYNYVETPNWGDASHGYHTVALPYERYPRELIAPRNSEIKIECADISPNLSHYIIKFQISEVLNRDSKDFEDRLFDCINLLQENVGDCDIEKASVTLQDYIQTLNVSWDILPPGTKEEAISRLFSGRTPPQRELATASERYDFFMTLKPKKLIYGRSGLQRYFGALIEDNLVVFENIRYGNAIYIMFEAWEELSQKSRIDLLSGKYGKNFERIIHTGKWKSQVKGIIREKLKRSKTSNIK